MDPYLNLLLLLQELLDQAQELEDCPRFTDLFGTAEEDPAGMCPRCPGRVQGRHVR